MFFFGGLRYFLVVCFFLHLFKQKLPLLDNVQKKAVFFLRDHFPKENHIEPLNAGKVAQEVLLYPILESRIFVLLLCPSVTLTFPPLDSKIWSTVELWSKLISLNIKTKRMQIFIL